MRARAWLAIAFSGSIAGATGVVAIGCMDCPTCDVRTEPWAPLDASVGRLPARPGIDAPPSCMTNSATVLGPPSAGPLAHQSRCTTQAINDMATACFASLTDAGRDVDAGSDANTNDAGAIDAGDACAAFIAANPSCAECIWHTAKDAGLEPSPVVVQNPKTGAFFVDLSGCFATLSDADAACKREYDGLGLCAAATCSTCANENDLEECESYAASDPGSVCVSLFPVSDACENAVDDSVTDDAAQAGCEPVLDDLGSELTAVANTFCGP